MCDNYGDILKSYHMSLSTEEYHDFLSTYVKSIASHNKIIHSNDVCNSDLQLCINHEFKMFKEMHTSLHVVDCYTGQKVTCNTFYLMV